MKIVINPGHGGGEYPDHILDPGAVGKNGLKEHTVARSVGLELQKQLAAEKPDWEVHVIIQSAITSQSKRLKDLKSKINAVNPNLFLSLHCNSSGTAPKHNRVEVYYEKKDESSARFARVLSETFDVATDRRVVSNSTYMVLKSTYSTGALLEMGFINIPTVEAQMKTTKWVTEAATKIMNGIIKTIEG
jgi:N-acetylmuramoyl-L-alanine amidase